MNIQQWANGGDGGGLLCDLLRLLGLFRSEEREEISSVNADSEEPDVEEVERIRSVPEETNKCYFCEYKAPVPWIHPSKGDNLSGMDIWDHVWSEHPQESEWFA